ncbi:hypothetical protein EG240_04300 [Paenimyroides tangerinum]|uniref:Lipoprotein n=1 Tax=Paenimyroides tangerinum TaxID=2488728 RepID=A0A3P3WH81_9FLAO|nr:hypothetical protein [Paenimyroides tangerinum]RRJ92013.1 hypothetical protein EG240_04300 [Paenimyroides tangerinum]
MFRKTLLLAFTITFLGCKNDTKKSNKVINDSITNDIKILENNIDVRSFPKETDISKFPKTEFVTTLESKINTNKNIVYCVTMLYAWNEIKKTINLPIQIDANFKHLLLLDTSVSFKDVLNKDEYTIINGINGDSIRVKAEFSKSLEFETELNEYKDRLKFNNEEVMSFGVTGYNSYEKLKIISIIYYKNDNNFVIKLQPKDSNHEIVLFKSEKNFTKMSDINDEVIKLSAQGNKDKQNEKIKWKYDILVEDEIIIPKFNFNIEKTYKDLAGNTFSTKELNYNIERAWQRTAFILDEKGAKSESEAVIEYVTEEIEEDPNKSKPKKMIFDKPFFIMLKKTSSQNPYFGLWINNTELMIKK